MELGLETPLARSPTGGMFALSHIGVTARGQRYTSVGLPGTGLSWREYKPAAPDARCDLCAPGHLHFPAWLALVIVLAIVIAVIAFSAL